MKKRICLIFSIFLAASLAGCGQAKQKPAQDAEYSVSDSAEQESGTMPEEELSADLSGPEEADMDAMAVTQEQLYAGYYEKLMEIQGAYGDAGYLYYSSEFIDENAKSVLYANLIDFDKDGKDEFVVAFDNGQEYDPVTDTLPWRVQIWGWQNGSVVKLYEGNPFDNYVALNIVYHYDNDDIYFVSGYGLHEAPANNWIENKLENGMFVEAHRYVSDYDSYDQETDNYIGYRDISIDGQEAPEQDVLNKIEECQAQSEIIPIVSEMDFETDVSGANAALGDTLDKLRAGINGESGYVVRYTGDQLLQMVTNYYSVRNTDPTLHYAIEAETDETCDIRIYEDHPDHIVTLETYSISKVDAAGCDKWGNFVDFRYAKASGPDAGTAAADPNAAGTSVTDPNAAGTVTTDPNAPGMPSVDANPAGTPVTDPNAAGTAAADPAAGTSGDYIFPNSNTVLLTEADLAGKSKEQLRLARNEIAARVGRKFKDQSLQQYFNQKSWYQPSIEPDYFDANIDTILNDVARQNMNFIKAHE